MGRAGVQATSTKEGVLQHPLFFCSHVDGHKDAQDCKLMGKKTRKEGRTDAWLIAVFSLRKKMATDQIHCKSNECLRNIQGASTCAQVYTGVHRCMHK